MQSLPVEGREGCTNSCRQTAGTRREARRVNGIANHRMTDMRHVHAYLVRAARFKLQFDERSQRLALVAAISLDDLIVRRRVPACVAPDDSHARTVASTTSKGRIHGSRGTQ